MALTVIAAGSWRLQELYLRNCRGISDTGISRIAKAGSTLRILDLYGCSGVGEFGDTALIEIGAIAMGLTYLDLSKVKRIEDAGLRAIAVGCQKLEYFALNGCDRLNVWSYGFYDTILYRCMLDQEHRLGIWRVVDIILRNKETTVDKTSDAISNSLHLSDISLSGIESVFRFGLLSVAQFIPGLTVFVLLRGVSWILTGSSNYRIRQIRNRKQILDNYWRRKYVIRNDST
eukprot:gene19920-25880_t